jgi:hypothetical protein
MIKALENPHFNKLTFKKFHKKNLKRLVAIQSVEVVVLEALENN